MSARLVLLCMAVVLAATTSSRAQPAPVRDLRQPGDYDAEHTGWNGLSTFASIARGVGLKVVQRSEFEWKEVTSDDVVIFLYPTRHLDPTDVINFVRNGGRVVLADDFGAMAPIFERLGASRGENLPNATEYHADLPYAPLALPTKDHPLTDGVPSLVTNHPAAMNLTPAIHSVFGFGSAATVVGIGEMGRGSYVLLADPSILINSMLQFEGNLQFAVNLLKVLRRKQTGRILILTGQIELTGHPHNYASDGTWQGDLEGGIARVDGFLDEANEYLLTSIGLRVVALALALSLGVLAFRLFPRRKRHSPHGSWNKYHLPDWQHRLSEALSSTNETREGVRKNYAVAAAVERDNVNLALQRALNTPDPLASMSERELLGAMERKASPESVQALKPLLPLLRRIPQRAQALRQWQANAVGFRDLEELLRHTNRLYMTLTISRSESK